MPKTSLQLATQYVKQIRRLDQLRCKQEGLYISGPLTRQDLENIYQGLYLRVITSFEGFIEELFEGLLCVQVIARAAIKPRIEVRSPGVARDVIYAGRRFVDWLPFERTQEMATAFFRAGRPFTSVSKADCKIIEQAVWIRNAIAHQSRHAEKVLNDNLLDNLVLTPRQRKAAAFLRTTLTGTPVPQTRYEYYATELSRIATEICS